MAQMTDPLIAGTTTNHEPRTTDHGPRTTDNEPRTTDHEPRATDSTCHCLRSKEMYIHVDEPGWDLSSGSSGIFWCIHTQNALGPDGRTAEPARCQPGRACYESVV